MGNLHGINDAIKVTLFDVIKNTVATLYCYALIEQYFQVQDYALWDVIENGNSFNPVARTTTNEDGTSTSTIPDPVTTEEKAQKKNDVKARSMFQLDILSENISPEDLNLKFLRSLPSEWNTHVVAWKNKPDLDTMSFDDLYNNFKIIEQEVKRTITTSSSSSSQNMAFVSSPGSTNEVDTANIQVSTISTPVSTVSTNDHTANLSDLTIYAFLANYPNGSQLVHEDLEQIHKDDLEEIDLKWQLALLSMRERRTVNVEETSSKAMIAIDGASFDWSFMGDEEVPTNMALMAFSDSEIRSQITDKSRKCAGFKSYNAVAPPPTGLFAPPTINLSNSSLKEFQQPEFEGYGFKSSKSVCVDTSNEVKKISDAPIIEEWVSNCDEDESEVMGTSQREVRPVWNNAMRINHQNFSKTTRNFAPTAVLTKSGIVPISAPRQSSLRATTSVSIVRPINTAAPKLFENVAKPRPDAFQNSHSLTRRPLYQQKTLTNRNLNDKVNTTKGNKVTSAVGDQGFNAVKSSACWVWRPKIKV
ncbi:hypothetical protein Tco_1531613 [Tanacetum coccineum]